MALLGCTPPGAQDGQVASGSATPVPADDPGGARSKGEWSGRAGGLAATASNIHVMVCMEWLLDRFIMNSGVKLLMFARVSHKTEAL